MSDQNDQEQKNNNVEYVPKIPNIGHVELADVVKEMEEAYLNYAMSVIVDRALPDVRDGLKPVHRRILYAMHEIGLRPEAKFRKSAAIVGEVLGKYHPHGDVAVYDSLVRMAQDFSLRYPLIKGQGNFGSMDGDSAAAMRYTEAKMAGIAREMLADIEKDTVNFRPNYDGTKDEPTVMPARIPNLLINGVSGIAVGMATNIPPHNLNEICDATIALIDNPDATVDDLMEFVNGPDFPTGGEIYDKESIKQVYASGRGPIVSRAKTEIVEKARGRFDIIATEMNYQVNKASLVEKIADLVRDKKIDGIKDLRDESDKDGVRVVIELKTDAYPQKILNRLYKLTDLQKTFHVNMLALCDGIEPRTLSLKQALEFYIAHRKEVIVRRTEFELREAEARAHILEGLKRALDFIDQVISTIRASQTRELAKKNLISQFEFSEKQTDAILEMRLQTLAGLERQKIIDELEEKMKLIAYLRSILNSDQKVLDLIREDLNYVKDKYGDARKTKVNSQKVGEFRDIDLIPNEESIIVLTKGGYIKRIDPKEYRSQKRGGVGVVGMKTREEDIVSIFMRTLTHTNLLFFTNNGRVFQLKAYEIPQSSRISKGQAIVNFLQLGAQEYVQTILPVDPTISTFIMLISKKGVVKKTEVTSFSNVRRSGILALKLREGDELQTANVAEKDQTIILITALGKAIRFYERDLRPMGRSASGVRGIMIGPDDSVIGMEVVGDADNKKKLLILSEKGFGKKTLLSHYKIQKRGGAGIKVSKTTPKTGAIVGGRVLDEKSNELITISKLGNIIKTAVSNVPTLGRDTQGVKIMKVAPNDIVASMTITSDVEEEVVVIL